MCWLLYQSFGKKYVLCVIKKSGKSSAGWMDGCGKKEEKSAKIGSSLKMCALITAPYIVTYIWDHICVVCSVRFCVGKY